MEAQVKLNWAILLTLLALGAFPVTGCTEGKVGNGKVISQERQVENFTGIKVSTGIDLRLTQGDIVNVCVETDENLQEDLRTEVKNNTLHIYFTGNIHRAKKHEVKVVFIDLEKLDVSSGADATSSGTLRLKDFQVKVSSGGDANLELEAERVDASTSSGADMLLKGKTESLQVSASSGSDLNARELAAGNVKASASSGGKIDIHVLESLKANASSGGNIAYWGNPEDVDMNTSSGGNVRKRD